MIFFQATGWVESPRNECHSDQDQGLSPEMCQHSRVGERRKIQKRALGKDAQWDGKKARRRAKEGMHQWPRTRQRWSAIAPGSNGS